MGICFFGDPLEIRLHYHFLGGNDNKGSPRSSPRRQRSFALHLILRISANTKKKRSHLASLFLVTRWRFELQTHCLKG